MATGYLRVIVVEDDMGIKDAKVLVEHDTFSDSTAVTNAKGETPLIHLQTVDKQISNDINSSVLPFAVYRITIDKDGYHTEIREQVTIFEGEVSRLVVFMKPTSKTRKAESLDAIPVVYKLDTPLLPSPIIPSMISVKLGTPQSNAPVISVNYLDYIKNVASSEIYPTWPEAALRANILAIQSIALNRVYTEWYRQRGYDFQITSSPAFDQKFIPDRELYESISTLVDQMYRQYVRRKGFVEPLFTTFCDGKQVTCDGLRQWETVDYANQGLSPLQILEQFYGNNIEIAESAIIQNISQGFGSNLSIGSVGPKVLLMQIYLLRISVNYPAIPQPFPLNGVYDADFAESVRVFQDTFNLPVTGVIDSATWYKISFIYHSVKRSGETSSEGIISPIQYRDFAGELRTGSSGTRVLILQYLLNVAGQFIENIQYIRMDEKFGPATRRNVEAFQRYEGLPVTGVVNKATWDALVKYYFDLAPPVSLSFDVLLYPGKDLSLGDQGNEVRTIQQYLNTIARSYPEIPTIDTNGVFNSEMQKQVKAFQKEFALPQTGVINELTWDLIVSIYRAVIPLVLYGGKELRFNDTDYRVAVLQDYLNTIAIAYPNIPTSVVDQWYGPETEASVRAFQREFGLKDTGVVDKTTWDKILEVYSDLEAGRR